MQRKETEAMVATKAMMEVIAANKEAVDMEVATLAAMIKVMAEAAATNRRAVATIIAVKAMTSRIITRPEVQVGEISSKLR